MMQQLRIIPASELKIDRGFVNNISTNDSDRVLVQKTIEIGHELGMTTVAEGVDNSDQLAFLRANNCEVAQGYFFSKPLAATDLISWLEQYRPKPFHRQMEIRASGVRRLPVVQGVKC